MSNVKTGRSAIIEQFLADGIDHMFGNPGTVEQGFLDALADYPDMRYMLTLQETVAVVIGDGYARARHKTAARPAPQHAGLGNGIGMLYQAKRGHAPLVVIAGDAGLRYEPMDAQMAGDLVAMARPVTKWSTHGRRPAVAAAGGPASDQDRRHAADGPGLRVPAGGRARRPHGRASRSRRRSRRRRSCPSPPWIERAAKLLAGARRPMILIGDGVAYSGAQAELARVAELLGAEVWGANSGEVNIELRAPALPGPARAHVRRPQPARS